MARLGVVVRVILANRWPGSAKQDFGSNEWRFHHYRGKRKIPPIPFDAFKGQKGARLYGNAGIPGIAGNVVCVTYRI